MRKKSIKKAGEILSSDIGEILKFVTETLSLTEQSQSWAYDYAIIRLYRSFEDFILSCLVSAINNDTSQLSFAADIEFPKHLTDEVCEYIIVGKGYFDFKGRDGLIQTIKRYVPENHYLVTEIKKPEYTQALERLSALRNYAAHDSKPSKKRALTSIGAARISSSGAWLKKQERFEKIAKKLGVLATKVADSAPY